MAMVYLAIQESLGRPVALKVLNPLYSDTPEFSERFLKEGRIVASLQHTSIITIHDIGISDGFHYISMEYVDGGDLRGRIKYGISPEVALSYTEKIGEALQCAHAVNVVHRDVKPSNILFRNDGVLLLTDFGIAKQLDDTTDLTIAGTMLGSPGYLSPEQARGKPVDGRADIYSLGIMLYEMIVGEKPFQGDSDLDTMRKHVEDPLPALPARVQNFQPLLQCMLAKRAEDRFKDAASLLEFIREHRAMLLMPGGPEVGDAVEAGMAPEAETLVNVTVGKSARDATTVLGTQPLVAEDEAETVINQVLRKGFSGVAAWPSLARERMSPPVVVGGLAGLLSIILLVAVNWPPPNDQAGSVAALPSAPASDSVSLPATAHGPGAQPAAGADASAASVKSEVSSRAGADTPATERSKRGAPATTSQKVTALLASAEEALENYRLTTPPEDNALGYYMAVLELDAENEQAEAGFERIAVRYTWLAQQAIDSGFYDKAHDFIDRGLEVKPGDPRLLALRERAVAQRARRGVIGGSNEQATEIVGESPGQLWKRIRSWFE